MNVTTPADVLEPTSRIYILEQLPAYYRRYVLHHLLGGDTRNGLNADRRTDRALTKVALQARSSLRSNGCYALKADLDRISRVLAPIKASRVGPAVSAVVPPAWRGLATGRHYERT
jgi:hypothetical protein